MRCLLLLLQQQLLEGAARSSSPRCQNNHLQPMEHSGLQPAKIQHKTEAACQGGV
jgi:hypothetical protein